MMLLKNREGVAIRLGGLASSSSSLSDDSEPVSARSTKALLQSATLLSTDASTFQLDILHPGKLEPIAAALAQPGAQQHSALQALEALSKDSVNSHYLASFSGGVVVLQLYDLLGNGALQPGLAPGNAASTPANTLFKDAPLYHAVAAIANLTANVPAGAGGSALSDPRGVEALVRVVEQPKTVRVLQAATAALANLAYSPACRATVLRAGGAAALLAAASAPVPDPDIRLTALTAIKRLACGDERARALLLQAGSVPVLEQIAVQDTSRECRGLAARIRDSLALGTNATAGPGSVASSNPIRV